MCSLSVNPLAHVALVHSIASTLYRGTLELEDLVQEGILALLRAAPNYHPARGHLTPYLGRRIRWAMLDALERHHRQTAHLVQADDSALEAVEDPGGTAAGFELEGWLEELTPKQRRIMDSWLGLDGKQLLPQEIAKREGVSRQRIQQIIQEVTAKIRSRVEATSAGR